MDIYKYKILVAILCVLLLLSLEQNFSLFSEAIASISNWKIFSSKGKVMKLIDCAQFFESSLLAIGINQSLWRPLNSINHTSHDRILEQIKWSKFISNQTNTKLCFKKKTFIVFDTGDSYYGTNNKMNCPEFDLEQYCTLTKANDIKSPMKKLKDFDAAIFTHNYNDQQDIDVPDGILKFVYMLETPFLSRANLSLNNALIASYLRGSDISIPYDKWIPFENTTHYDQIKSNYTKGRNYAEGKSKLVVAFISNCNSVANNRIGYIDELKKYIPVDVFGKCGQKTNFTKTIIQQYKFYLSFENANCRDYITEKLYSNAYSNDAVPVAMGAHPDDYAAYVPKNSYILVENFNTPKDLAEYLNLLNKNDTLYSKYFEWKGTGTFYGRQVWQNFFCRVCALLMYSDFVSPPVLKNSTVSWENINVCLPRNQWYWTKR